MHSRLQGGSGNGIAAVDRDPAVTSAALHLFAHNRPMFTPEAFSCSGPQSANEILTGFPDGVSSKNLPAPVRAAVHAPREQL